MSIDDRLSELGLSLPPAPKPAGNYVPCVLSGGHLFTSGQIPTKDGEIVFKGVVGEDLTVEDGQEAARLCVLNALAAAKAELGSLDRIERVVKVNGYVRCTKGFTLQPIVINGASDFLVEILGDAGRHARAALGANELPLGVGVEIDFVFAVK